MIDKRPPKTPISNPTESNSHRQNTEFTKNFGLSKTIINQISSQSESISILFKSIDDLTNKINSLEPTILENKSYLDWFKSPLAKIIYWLVPILISGLWLSYVIQPIARLEKNIAGLEENNKDINKTLNSIDNQLSFLKGSFEVVNKNKAQATESH